MKRISSNMCGVLAIDKPYGMSSHDVVNKVRAITGERRVGHAGTLDPAATGLMLVCVGAATRLSDYLMSHDKSYEARVVFGASIDTDDVEGRVLDLAALEDTELSLADTDAVSVLDSFTGKISQIPPAYSAIKKNGVVAYKAAREGRSIELESRNVTVYSAELLSKGKTHVQLHDAIDVSIELDLPYWDVLWDVSKGTYIRALARDIGSYVGCGAFLGSLRRTAIADMHVQDAATLEDLELCIQQCEELPWCDPAALLGMPSVELDDMQAASVSNGRMLGGIAGQPDGLIACIHDGKLMAIYKRCGDELRPRTVIPGGVVGIG